MSKPNVINPNARLWVWWNNGLVKIKLEPEGPRSNVSLWDKWPDEEGYTEVADTYWYDYDKCGNAQIMWEHFSGGRDCDGVVETTSTSSIPVSAIVEHEIPRDLPWKKLDCWVYDQYARAAGY